MLRIAATAVTLLCALAAQAQHDISQVEPAPSDSAASTPTPLKQQRRMKKYDLPELAGARQALGSQLIDGRLPRPLIDLIATEGRVSQRVSVFEGGLVIVNMTGAATIRKKVLIPEDALESYVSSVSAEALEKIDRRELTPPDAQRRAVLRVYDDQGRHVQREFHPGRVLPKALDDQLGPLRDLLRAISEDREVTSTVAGYEPKPGDELVADDQKVYRVVRVVDGAGVVELRCLDAPTTIYVTKADLHLYFIGAKPR